MIRVFLKNGKAITHVDSDCYSINGKFISIEDEFGDENAIYVLDNIAGVSLLPKELDKYRELYLQNDVGIRENTKNFDESNLESQ